jgi:hypothetical protein
LPAAVLSASQAPGSWAGSAQVASFDWQKFWSSFDGDTALICVFACASQLSRSAPASWQAQMRNATQ